MVCGVLPFHLVFLAILKPTHIKYLLLHVVGISVLVFLDSIIVCTNGSKCWCCVFTLIFHLQMPERKLIANGFDPNEKRK